MHKIKKEPVTDDSVTRTTDALFDSLMAYEILTLVEEFFALSTLLRHNRCGRLMYQPAPRNGMHSPDIKIGLAEKVQSGRRSYGRRYSSTQHGTGRRRVTWGWKT